MDGMEKRTIKEIRTQTEEWLDERWAIMCLCKHRPEDRCYYEGALKAIEFLGYGWERGEDGHHTLYRIM